LNHLAAGEKTEALIADLVEQYQRGRSAMWYWRQVIVAIVVSFSVQAWHQRWFVTGVVALSWLLPYFYTHFVWHWVVVLDQAWYPRVMNWLLESDWDVAWRMTIWLHLWALTGTVMWCVLLATVAWMLARWFSRYRGVVMTVFVLSNVAQCLPYLRVALMDWVRDPGNPIWFFNVLGFATFALIATPISIICGGRLRAQS
jgi:hypothetical protein